MTNIKTNSKFRFQLGKVVTYGLPGVVLIFALGMFIPAFDWIWHTPLILTTLAALPLGLLIHWLIFAFTGKS